MLEIKIIKGSNFIIMLGIYNDVKVKGNNKLVSIFFKNSISSKRLKLFRNNKILELLLEKFLKIQKLSIEIKFYSFFKTLL